MLFRYAVQGIAAVNADGSLAVLSGEPNYRARLGRLDKGAPRSVPLARLRRWRWDVDPDPRTTDRRSSRGYTFTRFGAAVAIARCIERPPFRAWLSDFSTPEYHNLAVSNFFKSAYAAFTLDFAAASSGKSLIIRYQSDELYDHEFGNVTLQAVTLQGTSSAGLPVSMFNPALNGPDFRFSFDTQSGHTYKAYWSGFPGSWPGENFATVPGTGGAVSVTNRNISSGQRFYHVETQ